MLALTGAGHWSAAYGQTAVCAEYRAELSSLERAASGAAPPAGEIERLTHAWQQMGCGRAMPVFGHGGRDCDAVSRRITQLQNGPRLSRTSAMRHAELSRLVENYCRPAPRQREARGTAVQLDRGDALSAGRIDPPLTIAPLESSVIVDDIKPPPPPPPVNATCVRMCDGFPFPLSISPGGREGADAMCQALCPGAPAKAFFKSGTSLQTAIGSDGKTYSALSTANLFQKQVDPACTCKPQGQSWKSALRRAGELAGKESDDTVVQDEPLKRSDLGTLRGTTQAEPRVNKRRGPVSIDPDDDPLPVAPSTKGIVHLTPIEPPVGRSAPPAKTVPVPVDAEGKRAVRIVGPAINTSDVPGLKPKADGPSAPKHP